MFLIETLGETVSQAVCFATTWQRSGKIFSVKFSSSNLKMQSEACFSKAAQTVTEKFKIIDETVSGLQSLQQGGTNSKRTFFVCMCLSLCDIGNAKLFLVTGSFA